MKPASLSIGLLFLLLGSQTGAWKLCADDELTCSSPTTLRACHCDNMCIHMRDCCGDHDKQSENTTVTPANEPRTLSEDISELGSHFECHTSSLRYRTNTYLPSEDFLYIRTCPKTFQNDEIRNLCENHSTDIFFEWLVTGRHSKVTYRNIYCSMCWGDTDVTRWRLEYVCENENDPINPKLPEGTPTDEGIDNAVVCQRMPPIDSSGRPGGKTPVRPPGYDDDRKDRPIMPGTDSKPPGWNNNAARPPGTPGRPPGVRVKRWDQSQTVNTIHRNKPEVKYDGSKVIPPPVVNYTSKFFHKHVQSLTMRMKRSETSECTPKFVYPYCDNLRPCSDLKTVSTCQAKWKGTKAETHCIQGQFTRMELSSERTTFRNVECVVCNGLNPEIPVCSHNPGQHEQGPGGHLPPPPPLSMIFDPDSGKVIKDVNGQRFSIPLPKCDEGQILDFFAYRCRDVFCPNKYKLVSGVCTKYTETTDTHVDAVCKWIKFYADEFEMSTNASVLLTATGHLLPLDERAISNLTNSSVLVCENMLPYGWNSSKITFSYSEGTVIVSILLQTISLLCLLTHFIVYLIIPELRNTAGLAIMSLVVALFYAQFLLLISGTAPGHRGGCIFISITIHYFFLASFCWMTSLALDMTLTFSSSTSHLGDDKSKRRRFVKYSLFCWFVPLVIVLLAFLMDIGQSDTYPFNPGYGQGFCWITNKQGLWLWFLSPVAVLLCASFAMYTLTVYFIVQATRAASLARSDDKLRLFLYIKLSLIMGLTWILGFIWVGTKDIVTEYLFIVFNSLQGAFIFIAFVCRWKVFRLLRRKSSKRKTVSSRPTSTTRLSTVSTNTTNRKSMT